MKDFIHLLKYSYKIRKNKIFFALLFTFTFLILLTNPIANLMDHLTYKILLTSLPIFTVYILFTIELNLGKNKQNGKDHYNTSLLYHYSLLQSPKTIILVNLFELALESIVITSFLLAIEFSFLFYLKSLPAVFFFWYMAKTSQFLFQGKRFDYFASTRFLTNINVLNIILFIISLFLTIHFITSTKFSISNYIEQEYFLILIAFALLILFLFSSIYHLEKDPTPKLFSNQKYLVFNLLFLITSFGLSDPFYWIYRQDQYIFSLITNEKPLAIDQYLSANPQYLNIENNKSSTPLIKALSDNKSSETILAILKHHPNLKKTREIDGKNPLMLAVENCQMPVIKKLIAQGIDLNSGTSLYPTALFSIHYNDCFEAYPLLKKNGANMTVKNKDNLDFIQYGMKHNKRFKNNFNELNEIYNFE